MPTWQVHLIWSGLFGIILHIQTGSFLLISAKFLLAMLMALSDQKQISELQQRRHVYTWVTYLQIWQSQKHGLKYLWNQWKEVFFHT